MSDTDWLEPLDRRIEEVRRETEAIQDDIKKLVKQILEVKNGSKV